MEPSLVPKSGRPIVLLDDLLNAMKTVHNAQRTGISVSIEPTGEGVVRLNQLLSKFAMQIRQIGSNSN